MKKYLKTQTLKNFLDHNLRSIYYTPYKEFLDTSLILNSNFNFKKADLVTRGSEDYISSLVKNGLDPRHLDQETQYNPRRGLQNYNRSENFINESNAEKIKHLNKLNDVVQEIKDQYGKEEEWQDSYARVLHGVIEKTFNKIKSTKDFTDAQPTIGSLDYIEELLYVRYRLTFENIKDLDNFELKKIILSKDESLAHKPILHEKKEETKAKTKDSETLAEGSSLYKLFESIKMMESENKEIQLNITINKK